MPNSMPLLRSLKQDAGRMAFYKHAAYRSYSQRAALGENYRAFDSVAKLADVARQMVVISHRTHS